MLKTDITIEQLAGEVVCALSGKILVTKLILYGSHAEGNSRLDSDFDIAVISPDFCKMKVLEKIALFSQVSLMVDSRVELKGYTPDEFAAPAKGSMLEYIKNKGKIIFSSV